MLAIDTTRPAAGQVVLQRLGVAGALKGIPLNRLDQLDDLEGFLAVLLDPPGEVFERGGVKFQASGGLHRKEFLPVAPELRGAAVSSSHSAADRRFLALRRSPAKSRS